MADETLKIDANYGKVVGGVTNNAAQDITIFRTNPTTKRLLVEQSALDGTLDTVSTKTVLTASAPSVVSVGVASGSAVVTNSSRKGLVTINISSGTISFGFDNNPAVLNQGITLSAGGIFEMDEYTFSTGTINAIASGTGYLTIQEYT